MRVCGLMARMNQKNQSPLFFLVAGEASGDLLGASLMRELKKKAKGTARFAGVGGPRMVAEGIELLFPQEELAHMGLWELARHLPNILRRLRQTVRAVQAEKPAALITIDSPDFSFRVAKKLKGKGIPLIHYVAPTVWAWRPGRAKKIAAFLDHLLALLPFEPPYFTRHGLACTFVGHPLVESGAGKGDGLRFRAKFAMPEDALFLAVLPGSRMSEVARLLPVFEETLGRLAPLYPRLHVVIPTVPSVVATIRQAVEKWPVPVCLVDNDADKYDAFAACRAALACSGTVSVELAMANLPTVIAYKASPLTVALYRRFIKTKYATLLNIMQGRMVMPEYLQENCLPEKLARAVDDLLSAESSRARQIHEFQAIGAWLGRGSFLPSEKAAQTVWNVAFPSDRKKLCVLQVIPALGTGGAEQACVDIASALVARGDSALVVSSGGRRVGEIEAAGGKFIRRDVKTKNPFRIVRNAFWLADLIRREKVDILHVRSRAPAWSAKIACRMTGCRFVTTFHAVYAFSNILKKSYNRVMAWGERVIAISPYVAGHIREAYGLGDDRLRLVHRGVDTRKFDPEAVDESRKETFRALAGLEAGEKVWLLPARLSPIKGQLFLIRVLALLRERGVSLPKTLIVGDDQGREAYTQNLKELIRKTDLQDRVRLIGACADMPSAYASASLVVVPSRVPEGFGRVPVEAMAMGVPVIASALGAMQDTVVNGATGWLAAPDDMEAWGEAVEKALRLSAEERKDMAEAARARARLLFETEMMTSRTLAIYDELLQERQKP